MRARVWLISERYRVSNQSLAKPLGTATWKRFSSTERSAVSFNQVSKLAGESETWSSPRAARQTWLVSIDGMALLTIRVPAFPGSRPRLHGRRAWRNELPRTHGRTAGPADPATVGASVGASSAAMGCRGGTL